MEVWLLRMACWVSAMVWSTSVTAWGRFVFKGVASGAASWGSSSRWAATSTWSRWVICS